jgi:hypothetical protein
MFKTWSASDDDPEALARMVEGHLNEFAAIIESVSYSVAHGTHHVMAVYRPIEPLDDDHAEAAVSVAEDILERAQAES